MHSYAPCIATSPIDYAQNRRTHGHLDVNTRWVLRTNTIKRCAMRTKITFAPVRVFATERTAATHLFALYAFVSLVFGLYIISLLLRT